MVGTAGARDPKRWRRASVEQVFVAMSGGSAVRESGASRQSCARVCCCAAEGEVGSLAAAVSTPCAALYFLPPHTKVEYL